MKCCKTMNVAFKNSLESTEPTLFEVLLEIAQQERTASEDE